MTRRRGARLRQASVISSVSSRSSTEFSRTRMPVVMWRGEELPRFDGDEGLLLIEVAAPHDRDLAPVADAGKQLVRNAEPRRAVGRPLCRARQESAARRRSSSSATGLSWPSLGTARHRGRACVRRAIQDVLCMPRALLASVQGKCVACADLPRTASGQAGDRFFGVVDGDD
jgi:hypothetical protein